MRFKKLETALLDRETSIVILEEPAGRRKRLKVLKGFMFFLFCLCLLGIIADAFFIALPALPLPRPPWAATARDNLEGLAPWFLVAALIFKLAYHSLDRFR
ncbi:MAG TPA: hypothetical protein VIC28_14930 [Thermoanaerobaculia bacterium]|jgi:hypothetical protein